MASRPLMTTRSLGRRSAALLAVLLLLAGCWGDSTLRDEIFVVGNRTDRVLHAEAFGVEPRYNGRSPVNVRGEVEVVDGRWVVPSSRSIRVSLFDAQCYGEGLRVYDGDTGVLVATYDQPLCGLTEWRVEPEDLPAELRPDDAAPES